MLIDEKKIAPANMKCQISMPLCCLLGWFAMPTKNNSMLDFWKALKKSTCNGKVQFIHNI